MKSPDTEQAQNWERFRKAGKAFVVTALTAYFFVVFSLIYGAFLLAQGILLRLEFETLSVLVSSTFLLSLMAALFIWNDREWRFQDFRRTGIWQHVRSPILFLRI
jgi:hypothetical protein